jgi:hypothetical protein
MSIHVWPLLVGLIIFALAWWAAGKLIADGVLLNVVQVLLVVFCFLWLLGQLMGYGPHFSLSW